MPVLPEDIKFYKSILITDEANNGGTMSNFEIISGVKNNLFPDVLGVELLKGITRYRKVFIKNAAADGSALGMIRIYLKNETPGDDYIIFFAGNFEDKQGDLTGSERFYTVGVLKQDVTAGGNSLIVKVPDPSLANGFQNGDIIWIGDSAGNEEFHANITVNVNNDEITITLPEGDYLLKNYTANQTFVSSCLTLPILKPSYDSVQVNSQSGTFTDSDNIILNNVGTIYETWTITFTSESEFKCDGTLVGNIGTGNINEDFSPENPAFPGFPYFTIKKESWGGTWAAGDTLVFKTYPSACAVWLKQVVPAGSKPIASNNFILEVTGETL